MISSDSNINTEIQSESLNIPSDKFDIPNTNMLRGSVTASIGNDHNIA
jgi:hypothetical protein